MSHHTHFSGRTSTVLVVSLFMLVVLLLSGLVIAFVAFPHRDEDVPAARWLGPP